MRKKKITAENPNEITNTKQEKNYQIFTNHFKNKEKIQQIQIIIKNHETNNIPNEVNIFEIAQVAPTRKTSTSFNI